MRKLGHEAGLVGDKGPMVSWFFKRVVLELATVVTGAFLVYFINLGLEDEQHGLVLVAAGGDARVSV